MEINDGSIPSNDSCVSCSNGCGMSCNSGASWSNVNPQLSNSSVINLILSQCSNLFLFQSCLRNFIMRVCVINLTNSSSIPFIIFKFFFHFYESFLIVLIMRGSVQFTNNFFSSFMFSLLKERIILKLFVNSSFLSIRVLLLSIHLEKLFKFIFINYNYKQILQI